MIEYAAVILAAGQGTRMKSGRPKILHNLAGRPLITHALEAARAVTGALPILVVGHEAEAVRSMVGDQAVYVLQAEQLGTGHALARAAPLLEGHSLYVLVTMGDMPLLLPDTLRALAGTQANNPGPLTMLTVNTPRYPDFGRVVRDSAGRVTAVVEAAHATPAQRQLTELNAGAYCFRAAWLWDALPRLSLSPRDEYYLTDLIALAAEAGGVATLAAADESEAFGINTRAQLAEAETIMRRRVNERWLAEGVTLIDPATTYIEPTVELARDVCLLPNTHLQGRTVVGPECLIGPNCVIRDSTLGAACRVEYSVLEGASLAEEVTVGPFAHLRPGARVERGAHIGNFGEIKNSTLGAGSKMGHFSYLGDATVGAEVNIGAGTITCNYDGTRKNPTIIEDQAFIGSDTLLVAPVRVGQGARTAAGAVVTRDVPPATLAAGMPARPLKKLEE